MHSLISGCKLNKCCRLHKLSPAALTVAMTLLEQVVWQDVTSTECYMHMPYTSSPIEYDEGCHHMHVIHADRFATSAVSCAWLQSIRYSYHTCRCIQAWLVKACKTFRTFCQNRPAMAEGQTAIVEQHAYVYLDQYTSHLSLFAPCKQSARGHGHDELTGRNCSF